jgi:hypothetical protein
MASSAIDGQTMEAEWARAAAARMRDNQIADEREQEQQEQLRKSHFTRQGGFTQFSDRQLGKLRKLTKENPVAVEIFLFLTEHMSNHNAVACSHGLLCKITGKSRTTVHRAITLLKESQFIGVAKLGGGTVFHLNANIVWHSYGKNIHYAELHAPILLDPEENPKLKLEEGKVNVVTQMQLEL